MLKCGGIGDLACASDVDLGDPGSSLCIYKIFSVSNSARFEFKYVGLLLLSIIREYIYVYW
jgi:hypothetical protein